MVLREVGEDLTALAASEALEVGVPRSPYRERMQQRLGGGDKRPVVVLGPPGVGKSTVIRRWIADLLEAEDYPTHRNLDRCTHVWSVRGRRIIAGMSYVGQWEQRCLDLIEDTRRKPVVLVVEDIAAWGRIGQSAQSERCLADLFRGPVARGEVVMIGECTPSLWQQLEADAPAFASLFTPVVVEEPTAGETFGMLVGAMRELEARYDVAFDPRAFRTILELGASVFTTRAFPGKALELLEGLAREHDVAAGQPVPSWPKAGPVEGERAEIGPSEVLALVSRRTGVPTAVLLGDEPLSGDGLRREFTRYVMGQTEAVDAAVDVILRIKAGLVEAGRPYSVMLFSGPTGTGKTEMARCIAAYLYGGESRLLRFDMSEYGGPDGPARLVGDRFRPEGLLTSAIQQQPFAVVLLDEIEKAHPRVLNLLLQVFDEGRLTDAGGTVADFSHAVIVMTSNLGARRGPQIGFGEDAEAVVADMRAAVEAFFPPELFNRIDRVVGFRPLDRASARSIADKELGRLLARRGLLERQIYVQATEAVLDRIVAEGFEARDGARSLKRYLDRRVGALLAEEIASGQAAQMRKFHLYRAPGGFGLSREALREAAPVGSSPVEALLEAPVGELRAHLPEARRFVGDLLEGERLEAITASLRRRLSAFNVGRRGQVDTIYNLDAMRQELVDLAAWIDEVMTADTLSQSEFWETELLARHRVVSPGSLKGPGPPIGGRRRKMVDRRAVAGSARRTDRLDLLTTLAEVRFLERALARVEDPSRHAALVELMVIGEADARVRFGEAAEGLLAWLARALVDDRGLIEGAAAVVVGELVTGELEALLEAHPRHVVLAVAGLAISDLLEREHGCHVRESLGATSEVVRVKVTPQAGQPDPAEALRAHLAGREAFARALDAGADPLPDNPDALLPLVRRYRFDGPSDRSRPAEVEDYTLYWASRVEVRTFEELVMPARLLHMAVGGGHG